ncbi:ankyrin repeat domain-containing protein [bacterium]|nr:ankyrin repeat domain-containing protein [bacterium]
MQIYGIKNGIINNSMRKPSEKQVVTNPVQKSELPSFIDAKSFVNINFRGIDELIEASIDGDLEMLKKEIAKGTNVNGRNCDDGIALSYAISNDNMEVFEELLKHPKINVNLKDDYGMPLLHLAMAEKEPKYAKKLLEHPDIDVNIRNDEKETPLTYACYNGQKEIAEMLIQHPNINVNLKDGYGYTPLINAVLHDAPDIVELLLQHPDISVNSIKPDSGNTALMIAIKEGYTDCTEKILEHPGVNLGIKNNQGEDAWDISVYKVDKEITKMLANYVKGVDKRKNVLDVSKSNIVKTPVDINKLSPEENIWTEEQISNKFLSFVINKKYDDAEKMLEATPLINLEGDDNKIMAEVCSTGKRNFVRKVFNYEDNQANRRADYDTKRKAFLENTIQKMSYEELKENPVVLNTEDGFNVLMTKEEFNPNDKIDKKSLFEIACGLDSKGTMVKQILSKYDDVETQKATKGKPKEIKAMIKDYETKGKYQLRFEKIKRNMFNPETRELAATQLKDFINSPEFKPEITDSLGNSALHIAATMPDDSARGIIQKLIDKGVHLDSRNITNQNALISAIKAMRIAQNDKDKTMLLSNIKFLLDKGLDVNTPDSNGQTAFHHACSTTSVALLSLVLSKEPNIFLKDNLGHKGSFYLSTPQMKEAYTNYVI